MTERRQTRSMGVVLSTPVLSEKEKKKKEYVKLDISLDLCKIFFDDLKEQNIKDKYDVIIKNPITKKEISQNAETYNNIYNTCIDKLKDTSYNFDEVPKPFEKLTKIKQAKETFNTKIKKLSIEDVKRWKENPSEEPFDYDYLYDKSINTSILGNVKYDTLYKNAFKLLLTEYDININDLQLFKNTTKIHTDEEITYKVISELNDILDKLLIIKELLPKVHIITINGIEIDYMFDTLFADFLRVNKIYKYKNIFFYTDISYSINKYLLENKNKTKEDIQTDIIKKDNYALIILYIINIILDTFDREIIKNILFNNNKKYCDINNILLVTDINYKLNNIKELSELVENYKLLIDVSLINIYDIINTTIKTRFKQAGYFNIDEQPKDFFNTFFIKIYDELFKMFENAKLVAEKYNILPPELDFKVNIDDESPQYPIIKYNKDLETYKIKKRGDPTIKLNEEYEKLIEENNKLYQKYDEDKEKYDKELEKRKNKSVSYLGSLTPPNKGKNKSQLLKELLPSGSDTKNIKCNNLIDINTQEEIKDMPLNKLQLLVKVVVREHHDIDDAYKHEFEHYTDDDWTDNIKNPIKYTYCYDPFALYNYVVQSVNENKDPINLAGRKKLSKENLREMVKSIKFITKKRDQRVPVRNTPNDKNLNLIFILDGNYYRALLCYKIYDIDIVLYHLITFPADIDIPTTITSIEGTSVGIIILLRILFESNKLFVKHIYPFYISVNANISYYNRYIYNSYEFTDYRNKENWEGINKIERMKEFYRELEAHI